MEDPILPPKKVKAPEVIVGDPVHDKPFKPSNPAKRGNHSTIEKFPEYKENPPT